MLSYATLPRGSALSTYSFFPETIVLVVCEFEDTEGNDTLTTLLLESTGDVYLCSEINNAHIDDGTRQKNIWLGRVDPFGNMYFAHQFSNPYQMEASYLTGDALLSILTLSTTSIYRSQISTPLSNITESANQNEPPPPEYSTFALSYYTDFETNLYSQPPPVFEDPLPSPLSSHLSSTIGKHVSESSYTCYPSVETNEKTEASQLSDAVDKAGIHHQKNLPKLDTKPRRSLPLPESLQPLSLDSYSSYSFPSPSDSTTHIPTSLQQASGDCTSLDLLPEKELVSTPLYSPAAKLLFFSLNLYPISNTFVLPPPPPYSQVCLENEYTIASCL